MVEETSGIILDRDYGDGLIAAALSDGYLHFRYESEDDKQVVDSYVSGIRHCRFKRKSLELALLFQNVYINDPFEFAVLDRLQKEDIVNSWKLLSSENPPLAPGNLSYLSAAAFLKPLLLKHLHKFFKKFKPNLEKMRGLTQKYIFDLYDFVALWESGLYEEAIESSNLPLSRLLHIKGDPVAYIGKLFSDYAESEEAITPMQWFVADVIAMGFEINSIIQLMVMSKENRVPFVTNRLSSYKEKNEIEAIREPYALCLLPFREEVRYAPVVESLQDLLRLREKREITRFREVLNAWKTALLNGDVDLAERIRADISKANKEIKRLDRWKKVDKWLYYLVLPTMLVPYVSNLVTIASVWTRTHIEATERIHGWIGIAR